jgi:hypothetical protein
MEITPDGCQDYLLEWCNRGRSVHRATTRFLIHGKESHVCILKMVVYKLKQAPRAQYARIDSYLMRLGFTKSDADPNLYYKVGSGCPC